MAAFILAAYQNVKALKYPVITLTERERDASPCLRMTGLIYAPQHFLYFLPEPQGQGSLRPTF